MPINETKKRSLVESNYMNGNRRQNLGRDTNFVTFPCDRNSIGGQTKRTTSSSKSANHQVITCDTICLQDITSRKMFQNGSGSRYSGSEARKGDSVSMYSQESYRSAHTSRLRGGTNRTQQEVAKLIISPSQCKIKPLGMAYHNPKPQVNVICLKLHGLESKTINTNFDCPYPPQAAKKQARTKTRTRGTQSLYRESSAQTLPYLPPVSNDPDELEAMELFKLPTILPGDGPPGLYEVEVLERARKRWAFAKALKENFRKQLKAARQEAKLPPHQHILEAFEWEHWIEREEYIQECQMLRLEILIRMFDKREKQMHLASHKRIEQSCLQIEEKRKAALRKSEIEVSRAMRRLEIQHSKRPRVWRKEHISQGLGDPCSEFYAPKMRHGVDPCHRHFTASRKGFDMRMDDLEKRTVKMDPSHLKCPFAKLNEWAKPKEVAQEVEQNFCSEVNLRKLYESLRTLRETTDKQKATPLCLKAKESPSMISEEPETPHGPKVSIKNEVEAHEYPLDDDSTDDSEHRLRLREEHEHREYLQDLRAERQAEHQTREHLRCEMRHEEFETLIHAYEGNTIGWIMRFLTEEMHRLKEQRKLQFFTMLAKRERWRREAAEAGLRQKENCVRATYERLYQECEVANVEMAEKYMRAIMESDVDDYAEQTAEEHVVALAKDMDKEIAGWLQSFRDVQNPENYYNLRYALKDIITPDMEKIVYRLERDDCIDYIINDVLLANVYSLLEPYDVSFSLTNDFVNRLIDNDMYLNSPDCSSDCECECTEFCTCSRSRREAMAILRKLIRYSVPGRRWRTSTERVADENVKDILDDVFTRIVPTPQIVETDEPMADIQKKFSYFNIREPEQDIYSTEVSGEESTLSQDYCKIRQISDIPSKPTQDITKSLKFFEELLLADPDKQSEDKFLINYNEYTYPEPQPQPQIVHNVPSTHDISSVWDFNQTPTYCRTSSEDTPEEEEEEEMTEVEQSRENMEEWSMEMSSSHRGFEEEVQVEEQLEEEQVEEEQFEEEQLEEEEELHVVKDHKRIDSQVRFVETPPEEETAETNTLPETDAGDDESSGVIPVAFFYDPMVKYTVPVPSTYEMVEGKETPEVSTADTENGGEFV